MYRVQEVTPTATMWTATTTRSRWALGASWPKLGQLKPPQKALLPLENPCFVWLSCHCDGEMVRIQCSSTWVFVASPTGHLASTQRGGGGTVFRGRQRSREGRRRQEDLLQTSKLHPSHHTQNVWDTAGEPHLSHSPAIPMLSFPSTLTSPPSGRSFTDLCVRHQQLSQKNWAPLISFCKKGPVLARATPAVSCWPSPRHKQEGALPRTLCASPSQQDSEHWAPSWKVLSSLCLFCGRTFQDLLRIIPQTLTDKGWRVGGKDLIY